MKIKMEMLVAGTAMITAVAAVVVAIFQTQLMSEEAELERTHARLSVKPILWVSGNWSDNPNQPHFSIVLVNRGLGPAVIEQFSVNYKGQYLDDWDAFVEAASDGEFSIAGDNENINAWSLSTVSPGTIVPASSRVRPFGIDENVELTRALVRAGDDLKVSVCFCSIYQECWRAETTQRPSRVNSCQFDQRTYFGESNE